MLYRVGSLTIYETPNENRISGRVWLVSDLARIGRNEIFHHTQYVHLPEVRSPGLWLLESIRLYEDQ